jgi:hypothetical protein
MHKQPFYSTRYEEALTSQPYLSSTTLSSMGLTQQVHE